MTGENIPSTIFGHGLEYSTSIHISHTNTSFQTDGRGTAALSTTPALHSVFPYTVEKCERWVDIK